MMGKYQSRFNKILRLLSFLPAIALFVFLSCVRHDSGDLILITDDNPELYADIELGFKFPSDEKTSELLYYTTDNQLFTGSISWFREDNDRLVRKAIFENGLQVEGIEYDKNGNQIFRIEHVFEDGIRAGFRHYDANDQILRDWLGTPVPGDSLSMIREWHPNGQLKFEGFMSEGKDEKPLLYQGLMTLYDKQGKILEQERYKDGELVEKLK